MEKEAVVAEIVRVLQAELEGLVQTARLAHDEATSEESRPENQYDTRGLEASYLAHGLTERILHLRALLSHLEASAVRAFEAGEEIAAGALVRIRQGRAERWIYMAPQGGVVVSVGGQKVAVLSPASPLGQVLVDAVAGDMVEYDAPSGIQEIEVLEVR